MVGPQISYFFFLFLKPPPPPPKVLFLTYTFLSSVLTCTFKLAVLVKCCTGCLKENARLQGANQTDFLSAAVIVLQFCATLVLLANSVGMVLYLLPHLSLYPLCHICYD